MDRRVFFALWPDAVAAKALHAAARAAQGGCGGRLMRRETLHITLAFLGGVSAARLADARAAAAMVGGEPFAFVIDRLGCWKHNRILWAGSEAAPVAALAAALGAGLKSAGFQLDARPFAAHVTLLRDARCPTPLPPLPPIAWPVTEFVLAESQTTPDGSRYEVIGRWPLGAAT